MYGILEEGSKMARNKTILITTIALFFAGTAMTGSNPMKRGVRNSIGNSVGNSELDLSGKVWVKKPDGSLSCDTTEEGKPSKPNGELNEVALKDAGIKVHKSKKANDGQMRAAMCGIPTGNEDVYLISEKDLLKARELGFNPVSK